jgi:short-subunit dehydrogenase
MAAMRQHRILYLSVRLQSTPPGVITTLITSSGGTALAIQTDVSDPSQVTALGVAAVSTYGRIDVWINNVGIGAIGYFWDIPLEDHARLVDVNLKGLIYGAHVALTQFRAQGYGTLINTGSVDSETPLALQNTYAATKAGVLSLSRTLNEELRLAGNDDIKVGTICRGRSIRPGGRMPPTIRGMSREWR